MTAGTLEVRDALVLRDNWYYWRWYDAVGRGIVKYLSDFSHLASDAATGDPTEWMVTITEGGGGGDSTVVVTDRQLSLDISSVVPLRNVSFHIHPRAGKPRAGDVERAARLHLVDRNRADQRRKNLAVGP